MNIIQKSLKWTCVMAIAAATFASSANVKAQKSEHTKQAFQAGAQRWLEITLQR
jgi:hypothetical protein